ncbi:Hypothetical protein AA314_00373 [Archangium gephyra]|uniref:Uncharacterized protein n=1 Tax=Archangium gephyra TaxID=48 RepID=A0AAC8Q0X8_9BACT|nr:Hypothetical protein AA314_00373 [Archangium gephyra]
MLPSGTVFSNGACPCFHGTRLTVLDGFHRERGPREGGSAGQAEKGCRERVSEDSREASR